MKVLCWEFSYGLKLAMARRFTEKEKEKFADWYKEKGLCAVGKSFELKHLCTNTPEINAIIKRCSIGEFPSCSNACYEITDDEWDMLIALERETAYDERIKDLQETIAQCQKLIQECEYNKLYTDDETRVKWNEYNNLHNEGGFGYVPHFYTFREYDTARDRLSKASKSLDELVKSRKEVLNE
jgi:hypothetical protein